MAIGSAHAGEQEPDARLAAQAPRSPGGQRGAEGQGQAADQPEPRVLAFHRLEHGVGQLPDVGRKDLSVPVRIVVVKPHQAGPGRREGDAVVGQLVHLGVAGPPIMGGHNKARTEPSRGHVLLWPTTIAGPATPSCTSWPTTACRSWPPAPACPSLVRDDPAAYRDILADQRRAASARRCVEPVEREHVSSGWALLPAAHQRCSPRGGPGGCAGDPACGCSSPRWLLPDRDRPGLLRAAALPHPCHRVRAASSPGWPSPSCAAGRHGSPCGIGAVLLLWSLLAAADGSDGFLNRREPVEHRLVGEWLHENTPPRRTRDDAEHGHRVLRRPPCGGDPLRHRRRRCCGSRSTTASTTSSPTATASETCDPSSSSGSRGRPRRATRSCTEPEQSGRQRRRAAGGRRSARPRRRTPPGIGFMGDG